MYNGRAPPFVNMVFGQLGPYDIKLDFKYNNQQVLGQPRMPQFQQQQQPRLHQLPLQHQSSLGQNHQQQPNYTQRSQYQREQYPALPSSGSGQNRQLTLPNYEGRQGRPCDNHNIMFCTLPECRSGLEESSLNATNGSVQSSPASSYLTAQESPISSPFRTTNGSVQSSQASSYVTAQESPNSSPFRTQTPIPGVQKVEFWKGYGQYEHFTSPGPSTSASPHSSWSPGSGGQMQSRAVHLYPMDHRYSCHQKDATSSKHLSP